MKPRHAGAWARSHWQVLLLAAIGTSTAFFRLDARGLWGDEVWQVWWSDPRVFIRLRHPTDLPMQYILVRLTTLFGQSEFWVRLPSAVLASANVVVLFLLGRLVFNTTTGWIAALLLAAAPYHVWYAQEAHQYAALSFYSTLSLYFCCTLLNEPTRRNAVRFGLVTIVNLANHFCAVMPWATEVLVAGGWTFVRWWREPRSRQDLMKLMFPLLAVTASGIVPLLVASPLVGKAAYYLFVQGYVFDPNIPPARIDAPIVVDILSRLGSGAGIPMVLSGAAGAIGILAALYYRRWLGLSVIVTWLGFPFIALALLQPRVYVNARYFLFMQPVYLLLVGWGLAQTFVLVSAAIRWLIGSTRAEIVARLAGALLVGAIVLDEMALTWNGYWVERVNDWSAVCRYLHRHVVPGDIVVGDSYVEGILAWCYPKARGVSVLGPQVYTVAELTRRGHTWYLDVKASRRPGLERTAAANVIPRAEWAPKDVLPPGFDNGGRLRYPQAEHPVTVLSHPVVSVASDLVFRDVVYGPGMPAYTHVISEDSRAFWLRLAPSQPRVLRLEYWDLPGISLRLAAGGTAIAEIESRRTRQWTASEVVLPAGIPETFLLEIRNRGSRVAAVSRVQVRYLSNRPAAAHGVTTPRV
ncbi:MAG TPA: glycosyltransferase family 39 protein [Methylomirabilota bacterium]|nr:glycosyltransferase family 39 protein [Methylomirabilota bacterium]